MRTLTALNAELAPSSCRTEDIYIGVATAGKRHVIHRPYGHAQILVDGIDEGLRVVHGARVDPATGERGATVAVRLSDFDAARLARRLSHAYKLERPTRRAPFTNGRLIVGGSAA